MNETLAGILIIILGYLSGSLTFSLWISKIKLGIDIREFGSHHATTTNTIRQAGWGAGIIVFVLDVAKGYVPALIAVRYSGLGWVIAITAMATVAGHCWPVFANFKGGMGLAVTAGAVLVLYPFGVLTALGILIFLTLVTKHSAKASFIMGLLLGPLFWSLGQNLIIISTGVSTGAVIAVRFLSDWNRQYKELWLDREIKD